MKNNERSKETLAEKMKESLWSLAQETKAGSVEPNVAKTYCNSCRTLLSVIKEERYTKIHNATVAKASDHVTF